VSYDSVDGLDVRLAGEVLRIIIDRPASRNAMDDPMIAAMAASIREAGQDEAVRVVAIAASGANFCAGADLVSKNAPTERRPRVGSIQRRLPATANQLIPVLLTTQTPVVCTVQGWAAGLGFHLALAADFCVAATDAQFWEPFLQRGFTPDSGGSWLIPRLVGLARARELLLLGRRLSGTEAEAWGLIHRAVPADELAVATEELIALLASAPTVAVGLTKWLLHSVAGQDLDRHLQDEALALELSSRSEDFREGLSAFRDKRDPSFRGR
jgi:2-(1,2-epoxy-1,2-dihydrophenyl)acetyl-CoA isomerase